MRPICSLLAAALLLAPAARAADLRNFDDAALRAVQFIDDKEGWAAGDDGVIWHSIDGGKDWERQPTGVRGSLRSIHFLNVYVGWVAGREELPGGQSEGVLLFTDDGGAHWQRKLSATIPGLNFVRFADDKTGYLAGDGSDQFPSGVFVTRDGGDTWRPVAGPRFPSWLSGSVNDRGAALGGAWGQIGVVRADGVSRAPVESLAGRALGGMYARGERSVAVGQGGAVLVNDGKGWSFSPIPGADVPKNWDFHAVHGAGGQVWAVGRPGTVVLHSRDSGESWEVLYTHQPLPLNGLFFRDERQGWAVGEFGTILSTMDGGKSWRIERQRGERAAVLFVHSRAAGFPLDTVGLLGAQEGYLTTAVRVISSDPATAAPALASEGDRLTAAWRQAGGAAAELLWQFPLAAHSVRSNRDEIIRAWNPPHGGQADRDLLRQMVLAIRIWRPEVVITDCPDVVANGFGSDGMTSEALREALRESADPRQFPEHANYLGLGPWRPKKLYARWEGTAAAEVQLDLTQVSPRLGTTLQDFATGPTGLLVAGAARIPASRNFRFLGGVEGTEHQTDLMDGIDLLAGGVARRAPAGRRELTAEEQKAVQQRTALRALGETAPGSLNAPERLLGQMSVMLKDMPDDMACRAAHAVASQFARNGQWTLASQAFALMCARYPTHPLTAEAYRWLIRHHSSSEVQRRSELGNFKVISDHQYGVKGNTNQPINAPGAMVQSRIKLKVPEIHENQQSDTTINPAPTYGLLDGNGLQPRELQERTSQALRFEQAQLRERYEQTLELEKHLAAFGPMYVNDPATQFCLQACRRNLGQVQEAQKWYNHFVARQPAGPWRAAAQAELWLQNRTGPAPKPVAICQFTQTKPFLDGKLDDACWQNARMQRLWAVSGDAQSVPPPEERGQPDRAFAKYQTPPDVQRFLTEYPTEMHVAYDNEYLYLAVRCFHPQEQHVPPARVRTRDADLRAFDRVSILLDLDRDYATFYHLQIDQRGCVAEDCWGDRTWDPRWFVALKSEPTVWVAEVAIPLSALTGDAVPPGRAWAFNAVRVLPGRGVQAWSLPADVPEDAPRPEGMGLLLFMRDPPARGGAAAR